MIIDAHWIADGINPTDLGKLIQKHRAETLDYEKMMRYYLGQHEILVRARKSDGAANNRLVLNHAKYITDIITSYLIGNPVTYAASEGYDIEQLKDLYLEQDIAGLDFELAKHMSIYGRAYELIYRTEKGRPESALLPPENAFVVYDNACAHHPLFGVYYFQNLDLDGNVRSAECRVYDGKKIQTFVSDSGGFDNMELRAEEKDYFDGVPLIEYRNNQELQGDFAQLIPDIDAYNLLMSDRVNDKEQFVDAFLFLKGILIDGEQAEKLKAEKILMSDNEDGDAKYLSKIMSENDVEVLRNNLKDDIHRFSMVPDLSDVNFGGNMSGVAIRYKLLCFEQKVLDKERQFAKGLRERLRLYIDYLAKRSGAQRVPTHRIDILFSRNLPANELEIAQMVNLLTGLASDETLLDELPFVKDAKEEAALAAKERQEKQKEALENARDFDRPMRAEEDNAE